MSLSDNQCFRPYLFYIAVFAANLLSFSMGTSSTWAVTMLPILQSNDTSVNPLGKPPSTLESSWIVSITVLAAVIGPIFGGILATKIGKKKTILLLGLPSFVGHSIIIFATHVWMFLIARFIMGITIGCVFGVMSSYIGDIAEDKNRGLIGSITTVFHSFGGLFVYCAGPYVSIPLFSLLNLFPIVLQWSLFGLLVPETPYDLIQKNEMEEAKRSLAFYRGKPVIEVKNEFENLLENINQKQTQNEATSMELFKSIFRSSALSKGFKSILTLVIFQGLSGMAAVASYYQTIFEEAGGSIESIYSVMIIGVVTLFATLATSQLIERFGRRILVLISFISMSVSLFSLGTYFYLKFKEYNVQPIAWLPIVSLIVFVIGYNLGAGIPWVFLTDMFSSNVIDICSYFISCTLFLIGFIISLIYPYLKEAIGNYGALYFFGSVMACAVPYALLFIPETKGKSVDEVQQILNRSRKNRVSFERQKDVHLMFFDDKNTK